MDNNNELAVSIKMEDNTFKVLRNKAKRQKEEKEDLVLRNMSKYMQNKYKQALKENTNLRPSTFLSQREEATNLKYRQRQEFYDAEKQRLDQYFLETQKDKPLQTIKGKFTDFSKDKGLANSYKVIQDKKINEERRQNIYKNTKDVFTNFKENKNNLISNKILLDKKIDENNVKEYISEKNKPVEDNTKAIKESTKGQKDLSKSLFELAKSPKVVGTSLIMAGYSALTKGTEENRDLYMNALSTGSDLSATINERNKLVASGMSHSEANAVLSKLNRIQSNPELLGELMSSTATPLSLNDTTGDILNKFSKRFKSLNEKYSYGRVIRQRIRDVIPTIENYGDVSTQDFSKRASMITALEKERNKLQLERIEARSISGVAGEAVQLSVEKGVWELVDNSKNIFNWLSGRDTKTTGMNNTDRAFVVNDLENLKRGMEERKANPKAIARVQEEIDKENQAMGLKTTNVNVTVAPVINNTTDINKIGDIVYKAVIDNLKQFSSSGVFQTNNSSSN